jgi:hypothetical protein
MYPGITVGRLRITIRIAGLRAEVTNWDADMLPIILQHSMLSCACSAIGCVLTLIQHALTASLRGST